MNYKLLLFFLLNFVCLSLHAQETIYTLEYDGSVTTKSIFIDSMYHKSYSGIMPYIQKASNSISDDYTVKCNQFKGWEDEAADYQNIEISYKGKRILSLTDDDGWGYFHSLEVDKGNANKPFYLKQFGKNYYVICFTSVILASQAPNLTIIVLKDGKATLVYHRPTAINHINENNGDVTFEVQHDMDYADYDDKGNIITVEINKHTLTFKDGMIYYK